MKRDAFKQSGTSPTKCPEPDFIVENHGSIFLLRPQNEQAVAWAAERIGQNNGFQPYWPTVVIEHRYIADIVRGIQTDGLTVRVN